LQSHEPWIQNVYNKYGISSYFVFDTVIKRSDKHRKFVEQLHYDMIASLGYKLCNSQQPMYSQFPLHTFESNIEHRQKLSVSQKRRFAKKEEHDKSADGARRMWKNPEYRKKINDARANSEAYHTSVQRSAREWAEDPENRKKISDGNAAWWANEDNRKHMLELRGSAEYKAYKRERLKQRYAECPELAARRSRQVGHRNHYGSMSVFKFKEETGFFKPYMHFILPKAGQYTDKAIVFIWDTREVVAILDANDVPEGYVKCSKVDSYEPLIF
jgi:hypothetical protein